MVGSLVEVPYRGVGTFRNFECSSQVEQMIIACSFVKRGREAMDQCQ